MGISGVLDWVEVDTKTGRLKPVEYKLATIAAVRELLNSGQTPPPAYGKRCKACSLMEICQPELLGKRDRSVGYVAGLFGWIKYKF